MVFSIIMFAFHLKIRLRESNFTYGDAVVLYIKATFQSSFKRLSKGKYRVHKPAANLTTKF